MCRYFRMHGESCQYYILQSWVLDNRSTCVCNSRDTTNCAVIHMPGETWQQMEQKGHNDILGGTKRCQNDNLECSQWWQIDQHDNLSIWELLLPYKSPMSCILDTRSTCACNTSDIAKHLTRWNLFRVSGIDQGTMLEAWENIWGSKLFLWLQVYTWLCLQYQTNTIVT